MTKRYSPRLNITLPKQLVDQVALYEEQSGVKRSAIIRIALREWLAKQPPIETEPKEDKEPVLVAGQPFDLDKDFRDYIRPDMNSDELWQTLMEFEAAKAKHVY